MVYWLRRKRHRVDSSRVPRPCHHTQRDAPAPSHEGLRRILQPKPDASRTEERFAFPKWTEHDGAILSFPFMADCIINTAESNLSITLSNAGVFPDTPPIAIVPSVPEVIWVISDEEIIVDASLAATLCGDWDGGRFARHSRRNAGLGASRQRGRSLHPGRDATMQRFRP